MHCKHKIIFYIFSFLIFHSYKDNYDVNKDTEKGQENTAFDGDNSRKNGGESSQQQNGSTQPGASGDEKWVSNYVPFGDYPKGNIVYVKEVRRHS